MRAVVPSRLEDGRVRHGAWRSDPTYGLRGAFSVTGPKGATLTIISSGTDVEFGWEHVSISLEHRNPNWDEMCFVKDLFWRDDECVVQFHPPKADYVNHHPHCLHLWRPMFTAMPTPPAILVGPLKENAE
jgi:hypothetical protein